MDDESILGSDTEEDLSPVESKTAPSSALPFAGPIALSSSKGSSSSASLKNLPQRTVTVDDKGLTIKVRRHSQDEVRQEAETRKDSRPLSLAGEWQGAPLRGEGHRDDVYGGIGGGYQQRDGLQFNGLEPAVPEGSAFNSRFAVGNHAVKHTGIRHPKNRFFILKSRSEENVLHSMEKGVWGTSKTNFEKLSEAFHTAPKVVLIFSVNRSQGFQGYAVITSLSTSFQPIWSIQKTFFGINFDVTWLKISTLNFSETEDITNPLNDNLPIKISRDGQEVPHDVAMLLLDRFDGGLDDPNVDVEEKLPIVRVELANNEEPEEQRAPIVFGSTEIKVTEKDGQRNSRDYKDGRRNNRDKEDWDGLTEPASFGISRDLMDPRDSWEAIRSRPLGLLDLVKDIPLYNDYAHSLRLAQRPVMQPMSFGTHIPLLSDLDPLPSFQHTGTFSRSVSGTTLKYGESESFRVYDTGRGQFRERNRNRSRERDRSWDRSRSRNGEHDSRERERERERDRERDGKRDRKHGRERGRDRPQERTRPHQRERDRD